MRSDLLVLPGGFVTVWPVWSWISDIERRGARFVPAGDTFVVKPEGTLTEADRRFVDLHREELLRALRFVNGPARPLYQPDRPGRGWRDSDGLTP